VDSKTCIELIANGSIGKYSDIYNSVDPAADMPVSPIPELREFKVDIPKCQWIKVHANILFEVIWPRNELEPARSLLFAAVQRA
jgi:hypothetical protein